MARRIVPQNAVHDVYRMGDRIVPLKVYRPERIESVILANTTSYLDPRPNIPVDATLVGEELDAPVSGASTNCLWREFNIGRLL